MLIQDASTLNPDGYLDRTPRIQFALLTTLFALRADGFLFRLFCYRYTGCQIDTKIYLQDSHYYWLDIIYNWLLLVYSGGSRRNLQCIPCSAICYRSRLIFLGDLGQHIFVDDGY